MSAPENEKAAVRTTIVGGRPPGSGRNTGTIPRGIEVLVKKAAVDPEFRELLFEQRGAAAAAIELELDPAENAMLNAIPREQLAQIVGQTIVPLEQRRVFLGRLAVAMLAVLGAGLAGCKPEGVGVTSLGSQPDRPPATDGIRPDRPTNAPPPIQPTPPSPPTNKPYVTRGIQPDRPKNTVTNVPPPPAGIQPDRP
jgi:hypothetical protein